MFPDDFNRFVDAHIGELREKRGRPLSVRELWGRGSAGYRLRFHPRGGVWLNLRRRRGGEALSHPVLPELRGQPDAEVNLGSHSDDPALVRRESRTVNTQ